MNNKLLISMLITIMMLPFALAVEENVGISDSGKFYISDVDVKVGSKSDKNLEDGDDIRDEAAPGDTVEFTIELYNNFTRNEDVEIEDVFVTVTIEGIDDGDDFDDDSKEKDIKEDDTERFTVEFDIPYDVDEDTFDVLIEAEGDSRRNGSFSASLRLTLEVKKENHEVIFTRFSVTPSEIKCSRTVKISSSVMNIGSNDEDDVSLDITSADLGISFQDVFDLEEQPFDGDNIFKKTNTFSVPAETLAGIYPITSTATYDDGDETVTETADLLVSECEALQPKEEPPVEETKAEDEVVVVVEQPTQPAAPTGAAVAQPVTPPTLSSTEEKPLIAGNGFLVALIAGEVLLVIIAIVIVVAVARRKQ